MRIAPMISLGLSILVGILAVVFGRGWLNDNAEAVNAPSVIIQEAETQTLLIATLPIARGDLLTIEAFDEAEWPAEHMPTGAITDISELHGEDGQLPYALGVMVPGEPLLMDKLSYSAVRDTLATIIEPGYRAASIKVNEVTGVAGFVLPEHRVDVNVYTQYFDPATDEQKSVGRTVLENIRVLGVDQKFEENLEGASTSRTVTLQVTPRQAKILGSAAEDGVVSLVLRPETEETIEAPAPVRRPVIRAVKATPAPVKFTSVRVIQGEAEETVSTPIAKSGNTNGN